MKRDPSEIALVERTLNEHFRTRALVGKLADPTTTHAAGANLTEFADLLTAHVRFEERELFERAQALCALHGATRRDTGGAGNAGLMRRRVTTFRGWEVFGSMLSCVQKNRDQNRLYCFQ